MQRKPLVFLGGAIALLMTGCDSLPFFGGDNASTPSPTPVAPASPKGSPVNTPKAAGSPLAPPKSAASPVGASKSNLPTPPKSPGASPSPSPKTTQSSAFPATGLIASLPGAEVLRLNQQGRSDPFAVVPVQPVVKEPTGGAQAAAAGAAAQRLVPSLPQIPLPPIAALPVPAAPAVAIASIGAARTTTGTAPAPANKPPASPPFVPQLPALPEPSLARLVEVSGILEAEGTSPKAIVKFPNETSSRYIGAGERSSDGLVLVKRIELRGPGGPVVVLEQFGVEVTRRVGDRPTSPNQTGGRAA